jgi:hypothetical protein
MFNPIGYLAAKSSHRAYEDGHIVAVNSDGSYDVLVGYREFPYQGIWPNHSLAGKKRMSHGDRVRIGFLNGNPNAPFLMQMSAKGKLLTGGNINSIDYSLNFAINVGLWLQTGGYWWEGYSSIHSMEPLTISPPGLVNGEDGPFTLAANPNFPDITEFGLFFSTGIFARLPNVPADAYQITFTEVKINGTNYSSYFNISSTTSGSNFNLQQTPGVSSALLFMFNIPDGSGSPTGPTIATTAITSLSFKYTYLSGIPASQISPGSPGLGPDTAISPRGIVMFPNTTGDPPHQMGAVLKSTYETIDGVTVDTDTFETDSVTADSPSITLQHTPIPDTFHDFTYGSFPYYSFGSGSPGIPYEFYNIGATLYMLAISKDDRNGDIDITYTVAGSTTDTYNDIFYSDEISIEFTLTQPIDPSTTLVSVIVDGSEDLTATLDVDTNVVTITYLQAFGNEINITYTQSTSTSTSVTESFTPSSTQQSVFTLSQEPEPGSVSVALYPAGNGFNFTYFVGPTQVDMALNTTVLIDGLDVRFAIQHPSNTTINIGYHWNKPVGNLWKITEMAIVEWDLEALSSTTLTLPFPEGVTFEATPVSQFGIASGEANRWITGWSDCRWGYLFYDPPSDCYTAVTPIGIFWRRRTTGTTVNEDYTFMPWPTEDLITDPFIIGWSYPARTFVSDRSEAPPNAEITTSLPGGNVPGIITPSNATRRPAPWLGVSVASRYALQGSWGPVGPGVFSRVNNASLGFPEGSSALLTTGAAGDTNYPIRFFQRDNTSKLWNSVAQITPFDLVADNAGRYGTYIPGCGGVYLEATGTPHGGATSLQNKFINQIIGSGSAAQGWWPAARNASAWFLGCAWCEAEWDKDPTGVSFVDSGIGYNDAGYTLSAFNPGGTKLSQITFKCDPNDILECYNEAPSTIVNYECAHALDWLSQDYDTGSTILTAPVYVVKPFYAATEDWGYHLAPPKTAYSVATRGDDIQCCWFFYAMTGLDGAAKRNHLFYPGIPTLADSATPHYSGTYGQIGELKNISSQQLTCNEDNNIYLCLSFPYWLRIQDSALPQNTEVMYGMNGVNEGAYSGGFPVSGLYDGINLTSLRIDNDNYGSQNFLLDIRGYQGVPIISGVYDTLHSPSTPTPSGLTQAWPTFNGDWKRMDWYANVFYNPLYSPNFGMQFMDNVYSGSTDHYDTSIPPVYQYTDYKIHGDFVVPYRHEIPRRTHTIHRTDRSGSGTARFTPAPGYGTFVFDMEGNPGSAGAVVYETEGDCRQNFIQSARDFLVKVHFNGSSLVEVWRKDISNVFKQGNNYGASTPTITQKENPAHFPILFTRQIGRYIVLLRYLLVDVDTSGTGLTPFKSTHLALEVWQDLPTTPGAATYTIYLPDLPDPYLYANIVAPPSHLNINQGKKSNGQEWVLVTGFSQTSSFDGTGHVVTVTKWPKWLVLFPLTMGAPVTVTYDDSDRSLIPDYFDIKGMAQAANNYLWTGNDGSVQYRSGG